MLVYGVNSSEKHQKCSGPAIVPHLLPATQALHDIVGPYAAEYNDLAFYLEGKPVAATDLRFPYPLPFVDDPRFHQTAFEFGGTDPGNRG
jgi:hypothetical protein